MIIATGMSVRTKVLRLFAGLLIMVFWHVILVEAVYLLHEGPGVPSPAFERLSGPLYIFTGALPFVLWILLAQEQVTGFFQHRKKKI